MPPVIIGVAVGAVASVAGATLLTAAAIGLASAALYSVATMDIPSAPGTNPSNAKQTIRSPNQPFRAVVGRAMVGGPLIFAEEFTNKVTYEETYEHCISSSRGGVHCETKTRTVTSSNKYLHLVIPLACHPCEDVTEVYFGDELKEDWDHEYWKINIVKGDQQTIDDLPKLLTEVDTWTDSMIGKGITFIHVALKHSSEHFPNGLPNIKCLVKGMHVKTPMFNGYTTNAAAVIYHFLRYHFGASEKSINEASFRESYAISGELMHSETPAPTDENPNPETPIRYAIDGIYDYDESNESIMNKMKTACGADLIFTNGQYHLQVAAYRGPVPQDQMISLSDLNGPVNIVTETPLDSRINTVKGQHLSGDGFFQQVDIEPVTDQKYIDEDGEVLTKDVDFEYVLNKNQAHRLALIILKDNRFGLTITAPMNLRGFKFNAGLPVRFDDQQLGYDKLEFRITSWKTTNGKGLELVLKQTSPDIYDDAVVVVNPKPPSTQLPDAKFCYPVENLTFNEFSDDGVYNGMLTWSHEDIDNVSKFEVRMISATGQVFRPNPGKALEVYIADMQKSEYAIEVIAFNLYGAPSKVTKITALIGSLKTISSVTFEPDNFEINIIPKVSGVLPSNCLFRFYRANDVSAPDPDDSTFLGEGITYVDVGLEPDKPYQYFVQVTNSVTYSDLSGPYSTRTANNPDDLVDFIDPSLPKQYTWVVYAEDAFGKGISKTFDPKIHKFEGRAYNKQTPEPSLNPLDYTFIRIGEFITPEEQEILDNLEQGKLPDGSGNLVKPDDVLFKPGDLVHETNIAPDSISTPKLQANAILADKIAANAITTAKLDAGAVTATKLAAQSVTADKIVANAVTAEKIAANAITADKIAVTVVSPVNNYSEFSDLRGWQVPSGVGLVEQVNLNGSKAITLKVVNSSSSDKHITSEGFEIDHNSVYEMRVSVYCTQSSSQGVRTGFGIQALRSDGFSVGCERYHVSTLGKQDTVSNPDFWVGTVTGGWRHMVCYVVGAAADINTVPKSINGTYIIKVPANARKMRMRNYVLAEFNQVETHFYSPSVIKVGSGIIVANEIKAGVRIEAPTIVGSTIQGGHISGTTGSFEGEVRAGKVVGVVGVDFTGETRRYIGRGVGKGQTGDRHVGAIKLKKENFDRILVVQMDFTDLQFLGIELTQNPIDSHSTVDTTKIEANTFYLNDDNGQRIALRGLNPEQKLRIARTGDGNTYLNSISLYWYCDIKANTNAGTYMLELPIVFSVASAEADNLFDVTCGITLRADVRKKDAASDFEAIIHA